MYNSNYRNNVLANYLEVDVPDPNELSDGDPIDLPIDPFSLKSLDINEPTASPAFVNVKKNYVLDDYVFEQMASKPDTYRLIVHPTITLFYYKLSKFSIQNSKKCFFFQL